MAKDNSYLTSFKIDLVRQVMEGHELKTVAEKYGVSKSILWGWKCKYGQMVCSEWNLGEPVRRSDGDFVDVVAPAEGHILVEFYRIASGAKEILAHSASKMTPKGRDGTRKGPIQLRFDILNFGE